MKSTLLISTLLLTLLSCNLSSEQDYEAVAKDTCDCVNVFTSTLSDRMIQIMQESDGDQSKLEAAMMEYMLEDPEQGLKDVQALENGESMKEMEACMAQLEEKYNSLYTTLSEEEIAQKIIEKLEGMKGCESTAVIMKLGVAAM